MRPPCGGACGAEGRDFECTACMAFPVEESRIRDAEETLGHAFPDALRQRLISENGGEIDDTDEGYWFLYPVYDDSDRSSVISPSPHTTATSETNHFLRSVTVRIRKVSTLAIETDFH